MTKTTLARALWCFLAGAHAVGAVIVMGCETTSPAAVAFGQESVALTVGERITVDIAASQTPAIDWAPCIGLADVLTDYGPIAITGRAPGKCTVTATVRGLDATTTDTLEITVNAAPPPPPPPPPEAGPGDGGPTGICVVPVAKMGTENGRDLYMAFTDVDSNPAPQTCPVHTSTDFKGDVVFGFLSGSPGYRINGRGNYEILTATPATLENEAFTSSAVALEDQIITMTFRKRIFPDEDAATPPTWKMVFRMNSDPAPEKWNVELFSFSKE